LGAFDRSSTSTLFINVVKIFLLPQSSPLSKYFTIASARYLPAAVKVLTTPLILLLPETYTYILRVHGYRVSH
jgi:hypothetical protein